ncbi:uncharacterized protein LOC143020360 [Oratosquilla oratoria]|uniref:uncharacterized protein LOC143020360 n=1 Tax=Oratosquilla oratoria TaxID=337810 RepID=UPI003F75D200
MSSTHERIEDDAEWFYVDQEFGTPSPAPWPPTRPPPHDERDGHGGHEERDGHGGHEEHDEALPKPVNEYTGIIAGVVSGLLGIVLILLIVYLVFLRKRLNKVKKSGGSFRSSSRGSSTVPTDDDYRIRVDDIAHLSNLDETTNTYVNTTDLQRLVSSVKAKKKSQEKPLSQAPGYADGPSRVVVRPPMVPPKSENATSSPRLPPKLGSNATKAHTDHFSTSRSDTPAVAASIASKPVISSPTLISSSAELPNIPFPPKKNHPGPGFSAPPLPSKGPSAAYENNINGYLTNDVASSVACPSSPPYSVEPTSPTVARPAPPPPVGAASCDSPSNIYENASVKVPPALPAGPKPTKPQPPTLPKPNIKPNLEPLEQPNAKPTPPTLPKPKGLRKGKPGLPPLKLALLPPSGSFDSTDSCETPDTAIIELTPSGSPSNTPDVPPESAGTPGSIGARIALLQGKMKNPVMPARSLHQ